MVEERKKGSSSWMARGKRKKYRKNEWRKACTLTHTHTYTHTQNQPHSQLLILLSLWCAFFSIVVFVFCFSFVVFSNFLHSNFEVFIFPILQFFCFLFIFLLLLLLLFGCSMEYFLGHFIHISPNKMMIFLSRGKEIRLSYRYVP